MQSSVPMNDSLHVRAQSLTALAIPPHFGKRLPQWQIPLTGLAGLLLATNAFCEQPAGGNSHDRTHAFTLLAQAEGPASIFSPWSDQDVRQGTPSRPDVRAVPREFAQPQPAAMPKDVRRSSAPSADAIPVYRKSNRDDLEDIRLGSRPDQQRSDVGASGPARPAARSSFITLQPFSDADLRQGSRRQPETITTRTEDVPDKPKGIQPEQNKKGFFGRALEKIGF